MISASATLEIKSATVSLKHELENLLSAKLSRQRMAVLSATMPVVLYGAGTLGRKILAGLRKTGIEPAAFADDTLEKQDGMIEGLPVLSPKAAAEKFGKQALFVVSIHNPAASFLQIKQRLEQLTGARVISFLDVMRDYPETFLPYLHFEMPAALLAKAQDIRKAFDLFSDEESRRQFLAHLKFRLQFSFEDLPQSLNGDYFPADLFALPPDITFVDCGAYDGDTIRLFLQQQEEQFGKIIAFEPDPQNYRKLCAYIEGLKPSLARRVAVHRAGVGAERGKAKFDATGNSGAAFDEAGNHAAEIVPLHEALKDETGSLYIKLDVEGVEAAALAGAEPLISNASPLLAVSVYHRPDDLWQIPADLHALNPDYHLYLRTLGEDGMDIVCFAVPQNTAGQVA